MDILRGQFCLPLMALWNFVFMGSLLLNASGPTWAREVSLTWLVPQEETWPFGSVSLPEEGMPGFPLGNSRESRGAC